MTLFIDMAKFIKTVKNAQIFTEVFLTELLHVTKSPGEEYFAYMAKCFLFLKDCAMNKELLTSNIKPGVVFQTNNF